MFVFLVYNKGETNQNKNPISLTQSHDFIKHFPEADLKPTRNIVIVQDLFLGSLYVVVIVVKFPQFLSISFSDALASKLFFHC